MSLDGLLKKLEELSIEHTNFNHEAVMTVDAQEKALSGVTDAPIIKNLFLKDKKSRFYLISALATTKININVLSARLGQGKGGVRMAPDEFVTSVLDVPLGSVTPLCVYQPNATNVVLILDENIKSQSHIAVHPLINTATTVMSPTGLETFLKSIGREPVYVDLTLDPKIDRDNPPDLKAVADSATPIVLDDGTTQGGDNAKSTIQPKAATAAAPKAQKSKTTKSAAAPTGPPKDAAFVVTDSILQLTLGEDSLQNMDPDALRRLKADIVMQLNALRNSAYASGFKAAQTAIVSGITGEHA